MGYDCCGCCYSEVGRQAGECNECGLECCQAVRLKKSVATAMIANKNDDNVVDILLSQARLKLQGPSAVRIFQRFLNLLDL